MKPYTILWADDDPDDLYMIHEILKDADARFQIIEVSNGKAALDYLYSLKYGSDYPCLIILDINMPVLDGKLTLTKIKSDDAFKNIPVVLFTTSTSELDKTFSQKHSAEMITKPPLYSELKQVVQRLLSICSFSEDK